MITVRRAADRYRTVLPGVVSRHCFSSGPHYDPANLRFGSVIAVDEHVVEPGAGFAEHAHRGVELISWVLDGVLRHEDDAGRVDLVRPGQLHQQITGSGIRHSETNASASRPLRFVQLWLDLDGGRHQPRYRLSSPPLQAATARISVLQPRTPIAVGGPGWSHLFVTRGPLQLLGVGELRDGDSVRLSGEATNVSGPGEVLVASNELRDGGVRRSFVDSPGG